MIFTTYYENGTTPREVYDTDALSYTRFDTDGTTVIEQRDIRPPELQMVIGQPQALQQATNAATLRTRAQLALAANANYLALPDPVTLVQATAQIKLLTRECTALIRLVLNLIDDTSGT